MAMEEERVNSRTEEQEQLSYEYAGNAVRKAKAIPSGKKQQAVRRKVKKQNMGKGYILFLTLISIVTIFLCVSFLKLKSDITIQTKKIASLESEISSLKAENDAYYNDVISSIDLDEVREIAINRLGMKYPVKEQIFTFSTVGNSYVRQYHKVPDRE